MSSVRNTLRAARTALASRRWQRARSLFEQVLASEPDQAEALRGVGSALLGSGAAADAVAWFERALARQPLSPELLHGQGLAQLALGHAADSVRSLSAALALCPGDAALVSDLARARQQAEQPLASQRAERLLGEGRAEEACALLEQAVARSPDDARAHALLGRAYLEDGRLDDAWAALEQALRLDPRAAHACILRADVLAARGDAAGAEAELRRAVELVPHVGHAWLRLSHLRRFTAESDADLGRMRELLADPGLPARDSEALELALGKALDDLGRPAEAFVHLERAHALARQRQPFDIEALLGLMDRVLEVCDSSLFERARDLGVDSELPVFVVGLPRSGSTLVEQIIASHPRGFGAGELRALPRLAGDLPRRLPGGRAFPECLRDLDRGTARDLAGRYLARLGRGAPAGTLRVCDKMLSNLVLVGLIAALFPRGRIVHVRRHLLDVGLSIWLSSFEGSGVGYAHDLEHIGRYHQKCDELARHFRSNARVHWIELEYETLVREPEASVRRLLAALGLEWDPRCLEPHRATRGVRTLSSWQVRQPIHTRSVERWRRYERELAPLRAYYEP